MSSTMMVFATFPVAIQFDDYHEIPFFLERAQEIIPDLRGKEIPGSWCEEAKIEEMPYWAIFWLKGDMPNKEITLEILEEVLSSQKR